MSRWYWFNYNFFIIDIKLMLHLMGYKLEQLFMRMIIFIVCICGFVYLVVCVCVCVCFICYLLCLLCYGKDKKDQCSFVSLVLMELIILKVQRWVFFIFFSGPGKGWVFFSCSLIILYCFCRFTMIPTWCSCLKEKLIISDFKYLCKYIANIGFHTKWKFVIKRFFVKCL